MSSFIVSQSNVLAILAYVQEVRLAKNRNLRYPPFISAHNRVEQGSAKVLDQEYQVVVYKRRLILTNIFKC
jgi:hypothetical protein